MRKVSWIRIAALATICLSSSLSSASEQQGIPPETVADYLYSVIQADRTFYTVHVVERMGRNGGPPAAENWRAEKKVLPLPAQFLMEASDLASKTGVKIRYRLISLWPINPQNGPHSETEKSGLEAVRAQPEESATATIKIGGETYFQAIYADRAVTQACIGCHNSHPKSPKKDFKALDVMGGLVIEIPLGR